MYTSQKPFPYLPAGREIRYVPEANQWMQTARQTSDTHATDRNHPTGGVIVRDGVVIASAANQARFPHTNLAKLHDQGFCLRRALRVSSGKRYWLCPGCAPPQNHSEALAVQDARYRGMDTHGADFYLWGHWWCCKPCWDAMIGAGIQNVYLVEGATERFGS